MATVLLCANDPILSEGLRRTLENAPGLDLVDCCDGLENVRKQLELHQPDILLLDLTEDITCAVLSGLRKAFRSSIVLWTHAISTELASQSLSLGIRGILRRNLPGETLIRCLTRVNEGELWFDKALTDSMMTARSYSVTPREGQLIAQLSQGLKNKEIATAMNITEGTVKVNMSRLFKKLEVKDRLELALYGLRTQLAAIWPPPKPFLLERVSAGSEPDPQQGDSRPDARQPRDPRDRLNTGHLTLMTPPLHPRRGSVMPGFALVAAPLIFVVISLIWLCLGIWRMPHFASGADLKMRNESHA